MPIAAHIYYHAYQGERQLPVVLIHGAGGNHLYWPAEIRRLADFRVLSLDLPGHGKSPGRGHQSISAYVEAIMSWLEAVNLHRAVFVGHSMGGAVALTIALNYPDQVYGLGIIGSAVRLRVAPDLIEAASKTTTLHNAVVKIIERSFSDTAAPRLLELAEQRMSTVRATVLHGDLLACHAFDISDRVTSIDHPVRVICGEEDRMTPVRYSQYLVNQLPNAILNIIPHAGHMVMLEKPGQVAAILRDFLTALPY